MPEVVTEFHLRTRHVYPDRNVVLTLQDLVTAGVLLPTRYRKNEYKEEFADAFSMANQHQQGQAGRPGSI